MSDIPIEDTPSKLPRPVEKLMRVGARFIGYCMQLFGVLILVLGVVSSTGSFGWMWSSEVGILGQLLIIGLGVLLIVGSLIIRRKVSYTSDIREMESEHGAAQRCSKCGKGFYAEPDESGFITCPHCGKRQIDWR